MFALLTQVALVALLGAMSPGADTVFITQQTLRHGRGPGLATAAGLSLGLLTHTAMSIAGLGFVLARAPGLFDVLRWLGAAYLLCLAVNLLRRSGGADKDTLPAADATPYAQCIWYGYTANLLNPKAMLFVMGILSPVLPLLHTLPLKVLVAGHIVCIHAMWNTLLVTMLAKPPVRHAMLQAQTGINRVFGCALLGLSMGVLLH